MNILLTGAAGFIGAATAQRLLARGDRVIGVDNLNDYYDVALKKARLARLELQPGFVFERVDIADREAMERLFATHKPEGVINLAAQPGVRYAFENPHSYAHSNLLGFLNVLEGCRHHDVGHLVFASSSSVYGANTAMPYKTSHAVDHPISLYAATKKSNELMAHCYAHLYGFPATGLRFFTVYGPWGRPDMAPMIFARKILAGEPIDVFNHGKHARDFTYIDDIVAGVVAVLDRPAAPDPNWSAANPDPASSSAPYRIYNIGNRSVVELMDFIAHLEQALGRKAKMNMLPAQPGDVLRTAADIDTLVADVGFAPNTPIEDGIARFVQWYQDYAGKNGS